MAHAPRHGAGAFFFRLARVGGRCQNCLYKYTVSAGRVADEWG